MVALLLLEAPADCWQRDDDNYDSGASGDGSVGSDDESFIAGSRDSEQSDEEEDDDGEEDRWKDGEEDEDENKKALCMYALLSGTGLGDIFCANHACRHCDADEDHDPASEYEDPLECAVCGVFGIYILAAVLGPGTDIV